MLIHFLFTTFKEAYHQKLWKPPDRKKADEGQSLSVNAESLEATLSDPIAIGYLLHFMTRQYCSENLRAWMVIDDYKADYRANEESGRKHEGGFNNSKNEEAARKIWNQFVGDDSVFEICVRDDERKKVDEILKTHTSKGIFDFAQEHAMETIRKDTWPRYLKSTEYKDYCNGSVSYENGMTKILLKLPDKCSGPWTLMGLQKYCRHHRAIPEMIFEDRSLFNILRAYGEGIDNHDHGAEGICLFGLAVRQFDELTRKSPLSDETKQFCWFVYFSFLAPGSLFEVPANPITLKKVCMNFAKPRKGLFEEIMHGCRPELSKCWKNLCNCEDMSMWRRIFEKALSVNVVCCLLPPFASICSRRAASDILHVPLMDHPNMLNVEVHTFVYQVGRLVYNLDLERATAVTLIAGTSHGPTTQVGLDLGSVRCRVDQGFERIPPAGRCADAHLARLRNEIFTYRRKIDAMLVSSIESGGIQRQLTFLSTAGGRNSFTAGSFSMNPTIPVPEGSRYLAWFKIWQLYTRMASQCLGLIIGRTLAITRTENSVEMVPHLLFVQYKERVGMERSLIAGILSSGEFSPRYSSVLTSLMNLQNFLRDTFKSHCSSKMLERFNELEASPNTKACEDLRALVLENFMSRSQDDEATLSKHSCVHAGDWYNWMTKRLSEYHEIERSLCSQMLQQSTRNSSGLKRHESFREDGKGLVSSHSMNKDGAEAGTSMANISTVVRSKLKFARASRYEKAKAAPVLSAAVPSATQLERQQIETGTMEERPGALCSDRQQRKQRDDGE